MQEQDLPPTYHVELPLDWLMLAGILVGVLAALLIVIMVVYLKRRRRSEPPPPPKYDTIDVAELGDTGPSETATQAQIYGTPVRIAAIVLAPLGRGSVLPSSAQVSDLANHVVPGLQEVLDAQQPLVVHWPEQLSWHGFTQSFFAHTPLPGDKGKGTPWCCVAGKFSVGNAPLVAGLVCRAGQANSIGQIVIEHEGQWLDVLRVSKHA